MTNEQSKSKKLSIKDHELKRIILVISLAILFLFFINILHYPLYILYKLFNHLVLHNILEFLITMASFFIAIQGLLIFPFKMSRNQLLFSALFFVLGSLNLMHTFSYVGMPNFITPNTFQKSTWFLFINRLTGAIGIFVILSIKDYDYKFDKRKRYFLFSIIFVLLVAAAILFFIDYFPLLSEGEQGDSFYKVLLQFTIITIHLLTLVKIIIAFRKEKKTEYYYLIKALSFLLLSDIIFTNYIHFYDLDNIVGHLYKLIGYLYLFRLIYVTTVEEPFILKQLAEKDSLSKHQNLNWMIEQIPGAFLAIDNHKNITIANKAAKRYLSIKNESEEYIGKRVEDYLSKENIDQYYYITSQALVQRKTMIKEKINFGKNVFQIDVTPITDPTTNEILGAASYYFDVTNEEMINTERRKLLEQYFKKSQNHQHLIDSIPIAFLAIDKNGDIITVNQKSIDIFGMAKEELLETNIDIIAQKTEISLEKLFINKALKGEEIKNVHSRILEYDVLVSAYPIKLNNNQNMGAIALYQDVTELEILRNELENMERLNLVGQMAASITHEIRNPMASVRGFIQLLKEGNDKKTNDYYNVIIEELDRANKIISDFLSLSQSRVIDMAECNVNDIIKELYPIIKADANIRGQDIQVNLDEALPNVTLNNKEIKQLILNLARNAIEAMKQGGILTITTSKMNNDDIEIRITDTGIGISNDKIDKLFRPFFTTKDGGTGLGLSVSKSIVEKHHGQIRVESKVNEGTTFIVTLERN